METKQHVKRITDSIDQELVGFVSVTTRVRSAMMRAGIEEAVLIQEEKSSHFHAYWLPILSWMKEITSGEMRNIQVIFNHAKEKLNTNEDRKVIDEMTQRIKKELP